MTEPAYEIGYCSKLVVLVVLGALCGFAFEPETKAVRCIFVGAAAPALLATWISIISLTPPPSGINAQHSGSILVESAFAISPEVNNALDCMPTSSLGDKLLRGFFSNTPTRISTDFFLFSNPRFGLLKLDDFLKNSQLVLGYGQPQQYFVLKTLNGVVYFAPPSLSLAAVADAVARAATREYSPTDPINPNPRVVLFIPSESTSASDPSQQSMGTLFLVPERYLQAFAKVASFAFCN